MNGKAERRWLGTSPCDNERTIALRTNALRAYEGKSSELIPGPRSRVGTSARYYRSGTAVCGKNAKSVFFVFFVHAAARGATCVFALKFINTLIKKQFTRR